jgi:hypothetical protein
MAPPQVDELSGVVRAALRPAEACTIKCWMTPYPGPGRRRTKRCT